MSNRLKPLQPPYPEEAATVLEQMTFGMPQPLALFRTIAYNPRVLDRVRLGGLLDRGSLTLRQREIAILRTTALCRAEYEWGVHVQIFAKPAGLDAAQIAATVKAAPVGPLWTKEESLILRLADALHASSRVDDVLYGELAATFTSVQLVELVALCGFYHMISFTIGAFAIANEPGAPTFPTWSSS
ncbi:MAG: carboxymuconolactone decarboxylase family protein [Rhodospirillales bacterium]